MKRDIDMFADAMEDTMNFIAGRSLLSEGISIASIERGKYLNDAVYKLYANPDPESSVTSNDAYQAVGIRKQNILICTVSGDSMIESGIRDGVKAIADMSIAPSDGNIIIARVYGNLFIKRFRLIDGHVWLYSENPDFPPVLINSGMEFTSLGVVLYYMDNMKPEESLNENKSRF
jgi:hypothetical protein